jgi:hypothetical protein
VGQTTLWHLNPTGSVDLSLSCAQRKYAALREKTQRREAKEARREGRKDAQQLNKKKKKKKKRSD